MSDGRGPADTTTGATRRKTAAPGQRSGRARGVLVWVLVVLSSLMVVVTGVAWWAHYTVMDTNGYMKIVGPIGKDPQAINELSRYISGQIVSASGISDKIAGALPSVVSGAATEAVQGFITKGAQQILSSPEAYQLWLETNRVGHEQLVGLLRGESGPLYAKGSDVKLNTLPLISAVLVWVDGKLPGALSTNVPAIPATMSAEEGVGKLAQWSGAQLPADFGQITLVTADALGSAQTAVKWFDRLMWIFPVITAVLMAVTILVASRRGRAAIALAVGGALAILIARLLAIFASSYVTGQIKAGNGRQILQKIVDGALGPLTTLTIVVCVAGAAIAVAVWLLGRRSARAGGSPAG